MKLLSFDIGIKNLAYCLLNEDVIEDWGVLNISPDPVCSRIIGECQCDKTAKFIINEDYVCASHQKLKMYRECKTKKVPTLKNPTLDLGKNIVRLLDEKPNLREVDIVLLENQPALKNPTMKSVQMLVYGYFLVKGISEGDITDIYMVNARNKLKAYKGPAIQCDIKDKYKKTKYLGIKYCEYMIHENPKISETFTTMFQTSKKQDDLSDAYLQGIYWINK